MKILNEDIKYMRTEYGVAMEDKVFNELVYRIHSLEKNSEIQINTNILLNKRNDKMTELCWNIRDYLITCKQDKTYVDIDKLINWLDDMFEGIKEDSEFLDSFIISDYIFSAQRSLEVAERNFRNNIDEVIELDPIEKNVMANILKDIYSEYPKWNKRGNI